jgi:hypothetical protein
VSLSADSSAAPPAGLLRLADDAGCDGLALCGVSAERRALIIPTELGRADWLQPVSGRPPRREGGQDRQIVKRIVRR